MSGHCVSSEFTFLLAFFVKRDHLFRLKTIELCVCISVVWSNIIISYIHPVAFSRTPERVIIILQSPIHLITSFFFALFFITFYGLNFFLWRGLTSLECKVHFRTPKLGDYNHILWIIYYESHTMNHIIWITYY